MSKLHDPGALAAYIRSQAPQLYQHIDTPFSISTDTVEPYTNAPEEVQARLAGYLDADRSCTSIDDQFEPDTFQDSFFYQKNRTRLNRFTLFEQPLQQSIHPDKVKFWRHWFREKFGAKIIDSSNGALVFQWRERGIEPSYWLRCVPKILSDGFALLETAEFSSRPLLTQVTSSYLDCEDFRRFSYPVGPETTLDELATFWTQSRSFFCLRSNILAETVDEALSEDRRLGIPLILDNYIR